MSSTVTVNVVVLFPSAVTDVGLAPSVVVLELGLPAVNVMLAFSVTVPMVAVATLISAFVDAKVAVKIPAAFVVPDSGEIVLDVPVLPTETLWLGTGLPWASFTVTVSVACATPSAVNVFGLATSDDVTLFGEPATNVTAAVALATPIVAVIVSVCARVEESVVV